MKKMKLAAMFAALVSVFTFSSCLDSDDNGVDYDAVDYFTLKEYLGAYYLAGDISGCSFVPVSQSVLASIKYTNSDKYANRFYGAVKFAEGESVTEGKTSYKISEIIPQLVLSDKEFNTRPDTLKSFAVSSLECSGWSNVVWAKNGYITVPYTVNYNMGETLGFDLYTVKASNDTLYTKFVFSAGGGENAYSTGGAMTSFKLPMNSMEYSQLQPKNDSIVIKVSADGRNGEVLEKTTKYKYNEY